MIETRPGVRSGTPCFVGTRIAVYDVQDLRERVDQLVDEHDRLWAQVLRLQERIRELERVTIAEPRSSSASSPPGGMSRAQRRRLEREPD